jgi:hypothetical protein
MTVTTAEAAAPIALRPYADAHGYKPGWIWHRLREQQSQDAGSWT